MVAINHCINAIGKDSRAQSDVKQVAASLVDEVLCTAKTLICSDPAEVFFYKKPDGPAQLGPPTPATLPGDSERPLFSLEELSSTYFFGGASEIDFIPWPTIEDFNFMDIPLQVREFIDSWELTPATKYALVPRDYFVQIPNKGRRYYIVAYFSKPTHICPNPLAVAKVVFRIYVPALMPKHYPVMVTYRFETYKSVYYALGRKQLRTFDMQRLFIDEILRSKLLFYVQIFDCWLSQQREQEDKDKDKERGDSLERNLEAPELAKSKCAK